ncbi:MAG: 4'-phosphopantetheinyl transferase superfamily protein, partial [Aliarcobacter sp.]|nr:4'-phosphopantetheinyl transferase superfamily protein [Aliarcobacter sp.]
MIGIDITSVDRIKKMYEKFGERAYQKFLNPKEIEDRKS